MKYYVLVCISGRLYLWHYATEEAQRRYSALMQDSLNAADSNVLRLTSKAVPVITEVKGDGSDVAVAAEPGPTDEDTIKTFDW